MFICGLKKDHKKKTFYIDQPLSSSSSAEDYMRGTTSAVQVIHTVYYTSDDTNTHLFIEETNKIAFYITQINK